MHVDGHESEAPKPAGNGERAYRIARRVVVGVVGATVLAAGVAMLVLPGPGLVVIPAGLAILGLEFAWARRWLKRVKDKSREVVNGYRSR
jgi:tellurite resistance protein TerC